MYEMISADGLHRLCAPITLSSGFAAGHESLSLPLLVEVSGIDSLNPDAGWLSCAGGAQNGNCMFGQIIESLWPCRAAYSLVL
jgi:hypothetical protein